MQPDAAVRGAWLRVADAVGLGVVDGSGADVLLGVGERESLACRRRGADACDETGGAATSAPAHTIASKGGRIAGAHGRGGCCALPCRIFGDLPSVVRKCYDLYVDLELWTKICVRETPIGPLASDHIVGVPGALQYPYTSSPSRLKLRNLTEESTPTQYKPFRLPEAAAAACRLTLRVLVSRTWPHEDFPRHNGLKLRPFVVLLIAFLPSQALLESSLLRSMLCSRRFALAACVPSSTEFKHAYANYISPKKADRTRYRYAARKGVREFGFGLAMDPSEAGKLGGRPPRREAPPHGPSRAARSARLTLAAM